MKIDWLSILNILGRSPADLVYYLVVGSALLLILIISLQRHGTSPKSKTQKHVLIGAFVLVSLQVLLFILIKIFNLPELISPTAAALVETLVHTLTLLWLIWTFIERDDTFLFTGVSLFTSMALLLGGAASLGLILLQPIFLPAGNTWLFTVWYLGAVGLAALGVVILWRKRPQGWVVGIAILLILAIGHGLQVFSANTLEIRPGPVRLAQTFSLPWAIILLQRMRDDGNQRAPIPERAQWDNIRPLLIDELLKVSRLDNAVDKHQAVAHALSLSLVADLCYLVKLDETGNTVELLAGYDLIREHPLPTATLSHEELPNILWAWEDFKPFAPDHPPVETRDAETLMGVFNYHRVGNLLAYPLLKDQLLKGGVIFLSPYTDKSWGESSLHLLGEIESTLAKVLFEPTLGEKLTAELAEVRQLADRLQRQTDTLSESLKDSRATNANQEEEIRQLKGKYQIEKLKMVKQINACQEKIIKLSSEAASHKQDQAKLDELKSRIHELVAEKDRLKLDLAQTSARIEDLESQLAAASISPKASQIEIISLDALAANIKLIFGSRCQSKNVNLEIENPDGQQLIKSNPERVQSLIKSLMENALLASKPEGVLRFRMELSFETGMLQIQVTDSGEGLSPEEQQTLFNELEKPPDGIGSLESLWEAVQLVQALDGKIWLRSKQDVFTSFRVQLPVRIID